MDAWEGSHLTADPLAALAKGPRPPGFFSPKLHLVPSGGREARTSSTGPRPPQASRQTRKGPRAPRGSSGLRWQGPGHSVLLVHVGHTTVKPCGCARQVGCALGRKHFL